MAHAATQDVVKNSADCAFDPKNIVINDVVKLYSCVPMADALCAQICSDKSVSTAINTTIENTKIGKTTIMCRIPNGDAPQKREAGINGLADTIAIQCEPSAAK